MKEEELTVSLAIDGFRLNSNAVLRVKVRVKATTHTHTHSYKEIDEINFSNRCDASAHRLK